MGLNNNGLENKTKQSISDAIKLIIDKITRERKKYVLTKMYPMRFRKALNLCKNQPPTQAPPAYEILGLMHKLRHSISAGYRSPTPH